MENALGSGLIDHSQKMTVAAKATAENKAAEHDLDVATSPIAALVMPDGLVPGSPTRDAGLDALGLLDLAGAERAKKIGIVELRDLKPIDDPLLVPVPFSV